MSKPLFQDIVPPDKRSIKKIPIPERDRLDNDADVQEKKLPPLKKERKETSEEPRRVREPRKKRHTLRIVLSLFAVVVVAALSYFFLSKVSGAEILLTPKGQTVSVDAQFSATPNESGTLPYQVVVYQKEGKMAIPATGEEFVQTKASGIIRIFNDFSSEPQKLVANTRFETSKGKIFRISQPLTVPGKKGDVPGSIEAEIVADGVGPEYNVGLTDFTIPGFKGTARYSKIFARSKAEIGGGFSGTRKKVDQTQVAAASEKIRTELETNLVRQMQQNIPDNFVFLPGAYFVDFESLPSASQGNNMLISIRATFHGIIFNRQNIAKAISEKAYGNTQKGNDIYGTSNLIFTPKNTTKNPWESNPLVFSLGGTTTLVSTTDIDKLKSELAGKTRKSLNAILAGYPSVAKAEVTLRPFWKQVFPDKISEISIKISPSPISQ